MRTLMSDTDNVGYHLPFFALQASFVLQASDYPLETTVN